MNGVIKSLCLAVVVTMPLLSSCSDAITAKVSVTGGDIEGIAGDEMNVYKGIPFAAPPVGDLRWKAPQPVIPWDGVREAKEFGNSPVQAMGDGSEDCLYLNVWTPARSVKDKMPVMVWIFGGGFAMGTSSQFDGAPLASKGVILVTINYRVGTMGFFAHPELSEENPQHVSGNYGILDQIAALQWVQDNISKFGGDPDNVTVFGESAGGYDAAYVIKAAVEKAGSTKGADVTKALLSLSYTGVTGEMTWEPSGNTNKGAMAIIYKDGVGSVFGE